jgi:hypothetical protein
MAAMGRIQQFLSMAVYQLRSLCMMMAEVSVWHTRPKVAAMSEAGGTPKTAD